MTISIAHPTGQANFSRVTIGNLAVWFSYETPIAFQFDYDPIVVRENNWGSTTGKHLNFINDNHSVRIPGDEFVEQLNALTERPVA